MLDDDFLYLDGETRRVVHMPIYNWDHACELIGSFKTFSKVFKEENGWTMHLTLGDKEILVDDAFFETLDKEIIKAQSDSEHDVIFITEDNYKYMWPALDGLAIIIEKMSASGKSYLLVNEKTKEITTTELIRQYSKRIREARSATIHIKRRD